MQTRVETESAAPLAPPAAPPVYFANVPDAELETPALPGDHPAWVRDAVALSMRARALLANVKPLALKVLTFWDHAVRSIVIGNRRVSVDACGSYRAD